MSLTLKSDQIYRKAEAALQACLLEIPFVRLLGELAQPTSGGPDLVARIALPEAREQVLVVEVKPSGQPRVVREAIKALLSYVPEYPGAYGVLMAPYVPDSSAAICEQAGFGFLDLAGNCHLSFRQVYIRREGFPNPYGEKRELRTLFSPKASRVLRVLLLAPARAWNVQELAREANVSVGLVSNVRKLLREREWARIDNEGLRLSEPLNLLKEWSSNQRYARGRSYSCYSTLPAVELETQLAESCARRELRYALTAFSAAARLAPMVRTPRSSAYVESGVEDIITELQLKQVGSGANWQLIAPGDEGVFYGTTTVGGILVASAVQVYLDLMRAGGRGEEAAEAILNEAVKPLW